MKTMKPWIKCIRRIFPDYFLFIIIILSGFVAAHFLFEFHEMLYVTFNWQGNGQAAQILLQKNVPTWQFHIMLNNKSAALCVLGTLVVSFYAICFLVFRVIFYFGELPEVAIKSAQNTMDNNPEFCDILNPMVQKAMDSDDGSELAEKDWKIRELVWSRKKLKIKDEEINELRKKIEKQENKLSS